MLPGPGIERHHISGRGFRRDHRDVGNAADVQRDARALGMAEEEVIDVREPGARPGRRRRCRAPEIRNHGTPVRSATTALRDLQRVGAAFMVDVWRGSRSARWAVAADGAQNSAGVQLAKPEVQARNRAAECG